MKLSVSNLAWEKENDYKIFEILKRFDISIIDLVPTKYFKNIRNTNIDELNSIRNFWFSRGFTVFGMQSIFFGCSDNLFEGEKSRKNLLEHFKYICEIGSFFDVKALVFGSPKNRVATDNHKKNVNIYKNFFYQLGEIASLYNLNLCLEPNPKVYNCNFMINMNDVYEVISDINHPNVKMQLDIGAMILNNEKVELIRKFKNYISHIHVSEPFLNAFGENLGYHKKVSNLLREIFNDNIICLEMLKINDDKHHNKFINAIEKFVEIYR